MRRLRVALLLVIGLVSTSSPIVAQSPAPSPEASAATSTRVGLEDRCRASAADGVDVKLCLFVVRRYLTEPADPAATILGLGDSQERDGTEIKLLEMDWNFKAPKAGRIDASRCTFLSRCHPRENQSVAALVRYECNQRRVEPSIHDWQVVDRDGLTYHNALWQKKPGVGICKAGKSTKGWITFYVPKGTDWLRLVENPTSEGAHSWVVERRADGTS